MFNNRKVKHLEVIVKILSEEIMDLKYPFKFDVGQSVVIDKKTFGRYCYPPKIYEGIISKRLIKRYDHDSFKRINFYEILLIDELWDFNEMYLQPK